MADRNCYLLNDASYFAGQFRTDIRDGRVESYAFAVCVLVSVFICTSFALALWRAAKQPCVIEPESRINPNHAPPASMARLPGIGIAKAAAIVAYRQSIGERESGKRVFESSLDLQQVKGIGPRTAQDISKWLKFE